MASDHHSTHSLSLNAIRTIFANAQDNDWMLDGTVFPQKEQVCTLSVILDPALLLDEKVAVVARGAFHQL